MIEIKRAFRPARGFERIDELPGYLFTPEMDAHKFIITMLEKAADGSESAVSFADGTEISARLIKADGVTELVDGSLADGAAVVTLPAECYQVPGRFTLTVYASLGGTVTCIYAATSTVLPGDTEDLNIAGGTVRNIDAKIGEIRDAISDAQDAVDDIGEAVAGVPDVIASIPQDYTALSNSVSDLKSASDKHLSPVTGKQSDYTVGTINSGSGITAEGNGTEIRSNPFSPMFTKISVAEGYYCCIYVYDGNTYKGNWENNSYYPSKKRLSGTVENILIPDTYTVRFVIGNYAGNQETVADCGNLTVYEFTDKTLSTPSLAADAKVTGDRLATAESNISGLLSDVSDNTSFVGNISPYIIEKSVDTADNTASGVYISSGSIVSNANFTIFYIPVLANKKYRIVYNNHSLYSSDYGAVAFSTSVPASGVSVTVLVSGTTDPQNIDYTYTPTQNGYLMVANAAKSGATAHQFYNVLKDWYSPETNNALNIQVFGDSITETISNHQ